MDLFSFEQNTYNLVAIGKLYTETNASFLSEEECNNWEKIKSLHWVLGCVKITYVLLSFNLVLYYVQYKFGAYFNPL
jgi:hypothetical protein